ncbi:MAG TPA: hypothetical protein VGJ49_07810 [Gaiellaceae bacterium]
MALFERKTDGEATTAPPSGPGRAVTFQSAFSRIVATGGIIGAGTGVAAIMGSQDVAAWIIGIVVSGLSVLLAAVVWSANRR